MTPAAIVLPEIAPLRGRFFASYTDTIMGEYATRKSDRKRIKIGTCEAMVYLRWEDRDKISGYDFKPEYGLHFRLPFPDEDAILPGDYDSYDRNMRLNHADRNKPEALEQLMAETEDHPGTMQLRHEASGLLLNVPCYHGLKLPEVQPPMQAFWNGKNPYPLALARVKWTKEGLLAILKCTSCDGLWRSSRWDLILPLVQNLPLRKRLERNIAAAQRELGHVAA
jgi:hypothetical protein